jgi:hypothetical protein
MRERSLEFNSFHALIFCLYNNYLLLLEGGLDPPEPPGPLELPIGERIWRKRLRLRLRAFADLSFAF